MSASARHIALVGSGNVAGFLGTVFKSKGHHVTKIISRNAETGKALANRLKSSYSTEYIVPEKTDLIIIAVKDDAIQTVANLLPETDVLVCHTAGAVSMDVLKRFPNRGILYPLQSIQADIDVSQVPLLIECHPEELSLGLIDLMTGCGFETRIIDSEHRKYYHLAAVFANNFSNAVLTAAEQIADAKDLDNQLLKPLIRQTFERALKNKASESQTGPALRNDIKTIEKHVHLLEAMPELTNLYMQLSDFIRNQRA